MNFIHILRFLYTENRKELCILVQRWLTGGPCPYSRQRHPLHCIDLSARLKFPHCARALFSLLISLLSKRRDIILQTKLRLITPRSFTFHSLAIMDRDTYQTSMCRKNFEACSFSRMFPQLHGREGGKTFEKFMASPRRVKLNEKEKEGNRNRNVTQKRREGGGGGRLQRRVLVNDRPGSNAFCKMQILCWRT